MIAPVLFGLHALALTSASAVLKRQDGGPVASNVPAQETLDEPVRGGGRRILGTATRALADT
jgi:hypothetical protein